MNTGVVVWIIAILLFLSFIIPIDVDDYQKVTMQIPYEKTEHSIEVYFQNVTTTKLVSVATPYNAQGYRDYKNTSYTYYQVINASVPYYSYGYGQPSDPVVSNLVNGTWQYTFNQDNCTTSFILYNPNYVPIVIDVNYTVLQENKKYWVGERSLYAFANMTIDAREYTKPIIYNSLREHGYDEKNYQEYYGTGICQIDQNSFQITFENSTFIDIKQEKEYIKLNQEGDNAYAYNYIGTRYILEEQNVTEQDMIPHTYLLNTTVIEYEPVERIVKKTDHLPIYLALFVLYDSYQVQQEGVNSTTGQ